MTKTKECREWEKKKKKVCPFVLLENLRPLSLLQEPQTSFSSSDTPRLLINLPRNWLSNICCWRNGCPLQDSWASLVQLVRNLAAMWETWVWVLGWKNPLENERLPTPVFWPKEFHDCIVHGVAKSWHNWLTFTFSCYIYFLVTKTFKMYSLCNFQIFNTLLTTITTLCMSELFYLVTKIFYSLTTFSHFLFPSPLTQPLVTTHLFSLTMSYFLKWVHTVFWLSLSEFCLE